MRKGHRHTTPPDSTCKRCGMRLQPPVPHECNPDICFKCNGLGYYWVGRENGVFVGQSKCDRCEGTGRTIWNEQDGEQIDKDTGRV